MKIVQPIVLLCACALLCSACVNTSRSSDASSLQGEIIHNAVLTQAEQAALTPVAVLDILKAGNAEYISDELTIRNNSQRILDAAVGQYPMAVILSCVDSRVPVEDVFHCGIGDLFVARVAGSIVNTDIVASMEFACKVSGAKLVVVLGHENCGAIRSAIQGVQLGNITELLAKIQPAIQEAASDFAGDASASNPSFVEAVCDNNVHIAVQQVREQSPILRQMEADGEIMIVGGVYNLETGQVGFFSHD